MEAEGICRMGIFSLELRLPASDAELKYRCDRNVAPYGFAFSNRVVFQLQLLAALDMQGPSSLGKQMFGTVARTVVADL